MSSGFIGGNELRSRATFFLHNFTYLPTEVISHVLRLVDKIGDVNRLVNDKSRNLIIKIYQKNCTDSVNGSIRAMWPV